MLVLLACSVGGEKGAEKGKGKDKAAESVWAMAGVRERIGEGAAPCYLPMCSSVHLNFCYYLLYIAFLNFSNFNVHYYLFY